MGQFGRITRKSDLPPERALIALVRQAAALNEQGVKLPPRTEASFTAEVSQRDMTNPKQSRARRHNAAFQLAWLKRQERPIDITCLDLGQALVLHLPGEPFVEYQLRAQQLRADRFVCVAGYGDGGPGYIPIAEAYLQGGYEPSVSLAGPKAEAILTQAMTTVLQGKK